MQAKISGAKNQLIDSDAYNEAAAGEFEEIVAEAFPLYEKRMREANAMDFDDLLVRTVNVIELFEEVRERWRRTFRHVLVDEYQDTNHAQYRLLQLLASEHGNLMVVGDEDQSIYGFRHADVPTSSTSTRTSRRPRSSSSSRTTARPRRSSRPPTRSSSAIANGVRRSSGSEGERASRCS